MCIARVRWLLVQPPFIEPSGMNQSWGGYHHTPVWRRDVEPTKSDLFWNNSGTICYAIELTTHDVIHLTYTLWVKHNRYVCYTNVCEWSQSRPLSKPQYRSNARSKHLNSARSLHHYPKYLVDVSPPLMCNDHNARSGTGSRRTIMLRMHAHAYFRPPALQCNLNYHPHMCGRRIGGTYANASLTSSVWESHCFGGSTWTRISSRYSELLTVDSSSGPKYIDVCNCNLMGKYFDLNPRKFNLCVLFRWQTFTRINADFFKHAIISQCQPVALCNRTICAFIASIQSPVNAHRTTQAHKKHHVHKQTAPPLYTKCRLPSASDLFVENCPALN